MRAAPHTAPLTPLLTPLIISIGLAGESNASGEEQKKLDVLSNDIMVNSLRASRKTAVLVSEELEEAVIIDERYKGKYCVVFDPLDGSSNIDAGVNIGTIFGVYKVVSTARIPSRHTRARAGPGGATWETCVAPVPGGVNESLIMSDTDESFLSGAYLQQPDSSGAISDVLRPGKEMVAAGYTMYVFSLH